MKFTTKDQDNDVKHTANCAVDNKGGWWYAACYETNLNGVYKVPPFTWGDYTLANWYKFRGHFESMKYADMKLRPI